MNYLQNLGPSAGRNGGPMTVFPVRDSILMSINRKTFRCSIDRQLYYPLLNYLFSLFKHSHPSFFPLSCFLFLLSKFVNRFDLLNNEIFFKFGN